MQVCWTSTPSHLNMTVRLINGNSLNAYSLICRLCPETPCDTGQEQIVCTWFSVETQNKSNVCLAMPPNTVLSLVSPTRTLSFRSSMPVFKVTSSSHLLAPLSCHDAILERGYGTGLSSLFFIQTT